MKDREGVLESLLELLQTESIDAGDRLKAFARLNESDGSIQNCQGLLERLERDLRLQSGWRAVRDAVTWPLREEEVQNNLRAIEGNQEHFEPRS